MADKKIGDLNPANTLVGTELLELEQGSYGVKSSLNQVTEFKKEYSGGSASSPDKKILIRIDTYSGWYNSNPILKAGEQGIETDTGKIKIGNGILSWNDLYYSSIGVNIMAFGAKGDGVSDDSLAFQNAVLSGALNIYIPEGIFLINNVVYLSVYGQRIYGGGTLKANSTNAGAIISATADKVIIENIKFQGHTGPNCTAIYSNKIITIKNCTMTTFYDGINLSGQASLGGCLIDGCYIYYCVHNAISLGYQGEYMKIINNTLTDNACGIYTITGNSIICNNNINANTVGIYLGNGSNDSHLIISLNNINHNSGYGIRIVSIDESMCTVSDNHLFNSGCTGYSVSFESIVKDRACSFTGNQIGGPVNLSSNNGFINWSCNYMIEGPLTKTSTVVKSTSMGLDYKEEKKRIHGIWPSSGNATVAHGISDIRKITAATVVVHEGDGMSVIPPHYTINPGYDYQFFIDGNNVYLQLVSGANIVGQEYDIVISYEVSYIGE